MLNISNSTDVGHRQLNSYKGKYWVETTLARTKKIRLSHLTGDSDWSGTVTRDKTKNGAKAVGTLTGERIFSLCKVIEALYIESEKSTNTEERKAGDEEILVFMRVLEFLIQLYLKPARKTLHILSMWAKN